MFENSITQTFEETYKHAYSHGLEAIYAIENVDLKSIRRLSIPTPSTVIKRKETVASKPMNQSELDFGIGFRGYINPFILSEPIQVLELQRYTEKFLLEVGKTKLSDLRDFQSLAYLKNIGQGHLEEIKTKTEQYFKGKELEKTKNLDFNSLIRCIVLGGHHKKMSVFLKKYSLDELVPLLPSESMELRRLTPNLRDEWSKDALGYLQSWEKTSFVKQTIKEIAVELIKPWMRLRLGMATHGEILEWLESLTIEPALMDQCILFISEIYCFKQFPFGENLYQSYQNVYCIDPWHDRAFHEIALKAKSYFYKSSVTYLLEELVFWIKREFGKSWIDFPDGMIEKVLYLCPDFYLWKGQSQKIEVGIK